MRRGVRRSGVRRSRARRSRVKRSRVRRSRVRKSRARRYLFKGVVDVEECEVVAVYVREPQLGIVRSFLRLVGSDEALGRVRVT